MKRYVGIEVLWKNVYVKKLLCDKIQRSTEMHVSKLEKNLVGIHSTMYNGKI